MVGVPEVGTKVNTRNYSSSGQSSERFSSAKLSCSRVALKRCIKTKIRWNRYYYYYTTATIAKVEPRIRECFSGDRAIATRAQSRNVRSKF